MGSLQTAKRTRKSLQTTKQTETERHLRETHEWSLKTAKRIKIGDVSANKG
jgi:hypothetical protein